MLESIYNSWVENCKPREPYPEMLDGYNDLPPEMQEKILRALKNGHVDDSEWKGVCLTPQRWLKKSPKVVVSD